MSIVIGPRRRAHLRRTALVVVPAALLSGALCCGLFTCTPAEASAATVDVSAPTVTSPSDQPIAGVGFIVVAYVKFREHKDNPTG
ncbi:MAG TPA: hypothetical protein VIT65_17980 [Microlunatus sp.]